MTLNRLVLHNYMIHRDLTADLEGNLIALTGEMGHGKSTFVGALQFCLTGEHPPWHREDLLSWGAEEGSAKLYFTHDGVDCSVLRKLHCAEAVLKIGDETVTGSRNVEKALAERGVDKDILKQIGFVQQYEIQSILFDDPGKRERSFQKLLGIGDASKIWSDLGTIIQSYSRSENFDASIESLKQMIAGLKTELEAVDASLSTSREALDLLPSMEDMHRETERLASLKAKISTLEGVRYALRDLNARMEADLAASMALTAKQDATMTMLGCTPEEMESAIDDLKRSYAAAKASLANMQKLSGASEANGSCPLCGARVEPGQIAAHTAAELSRLMKAEEDARKLRDDTERAYCSIKAELVRIDSELRSVMTRMASTSERITAEKGRERQVLMEFAELGLSPDQADVDGLKEKVEREASERRAEEARFSELSSAVAMLQGEKNAKEQQLRQAEEMLQAKVREKEASAPVARKVEVLTRVRNWFHSSNGPRTMSMRAIKDMTGFVNEYLKELHSEITVTPDNQGLSFAFEYVDGRPVSNPPPSTAKLSGGQKIELALAFRLAIYRYFGQKMGIMVLDEPTAHLSPAGIEYFGELLQTVSTLAKNMNLQIIMPTHEKEIMPFMDSEIHFS